MQQWLTFPGPQDPKQFDFHFKIRILLLLSQRVNHVLKLPLREKAKSKGNSTCLFNQEILESIEKPDEDESESHEHDWTYQSNPKQFAYAPFAYSDPYSHGLLAGYGQHSIV